VRSWSAYLVRGDIRPFLLFLQHTVWLKSPSYYSIALCTSDCLFHFCRLSATFFAKKIFFTVKGLLAPRPSPKLEGHPLLFARGCLFNIFTVTLHCWRPFLHPQPEDAYRLLVGKPEGKSPLERPRRRWLDESWRSWRCGMGWCSFAICILNIFVWGGVVIQDTSCRAVLSSNPL
jgi:hypothetical protein